jgi:hypothetical protein
MCMYAHIHIYIHIHINTYIMNVTLLDFYAVENMKSPLHHVYGVYMYENTCIHKYISLFGETIHT